MKRETQAPRFPLFLSMADGKVPTFARISWEAEARRAIVPRLVDCPIQRKTRRA